MISYRIDVEAIAYQHSFLYHLSKSQKRMGKLQSKPKIMRSFKQGNGFMGPYVSSEGYPGTNESLVGLWALADAEKGAR